MLHEVPDPAGQIDDPDEETVLDPAIEPDDEPTMVRLTPLPPEAMSRRIRIARGSSHGVGGAPHGRVGKYELRDKLGRGAFGVVFTARDPSLDRDVALKVLRPTHLTNQDIVQRFLQEARATARISHPGIVTIHDCGRVETNLGATAFIAMELLIGESLTARLTRSGRLPPETAAEIARQVASALEAAHRVDVLHRDLKPDNIYVVPDPAMPSGERIKVLDFGLAKLGREGHTQLQTVFGTPRYMSPEQCRSATQIDHRSDVYSLGCVLFELVTGRLPFDGDVRQLIERHQRVTPPRARSFVPELPAAFDDLIAEMLAKDPMQRPQTMGAVQRALHHASGIRPSVAEMMLSTPTEPPPLAVPPPVPLPPVAPLAIDPQEPPSLVAPVPRQRTVPPELSMFPEVPVSAERAVPRLRSVHPELAMLAKDAVAPARAVPRPGSVPAVPAEPAIPSERFLPRPRSVPPERSVPHLRSAPPERLEIPAAADAGALSGEVLVPAGGPRDPRLGGPDTSPTPKQPVRRAGRFCVAAFGLIALGLALIAVLTAG